MVSVGSLFSFSGAVVFSSGQPIIPVSSSTQELGLEQPGQNAGP